MASYVLIHSDPPIVLHDGTDPGIAAAVALRRLIGWSPIRQSARLLGGAEVANTTVTADNADGAILARLSVPPLRARCEIYQGGARIFDGTITRVQMDAQASFALEAAGGRPLSDPLPLRSTEAIGDYRAIERLPQVYGRVTLRPIPWDADGRLFLLADHPVVGVHAVREAGESIGAWELIQTTDPTGHPVALLHTPRSYPDAASLSVTLDGKPHPLTGTLMDTPAAVLWDILANLCGLPYAESDFDDLRADCEAIGLRISGVLSGEQTARAAIDEIAASIGAVWSTGMRSFMRLYPLASEPVRYFVRPTDAVTNETDDYALYTKLRIGYGWDWAEGQPQITQQWQAPDAVATYGERIYSLDARWLQSSALAEHLARRLLPDLARPRWRTQIDAALSAVRVAPGDWVDCTAARGAACSGTVPCMDVQIDNERASVSLLLEQPAGQAPAVEREVIGRILTYSATLSAVTESEDGFVTLTILDDATGLPLVGAEVRIDGGPIGRVDAAGKVRLPATPGQHVATVTASGFAPYEFFIWV